MSSLPPLSVTLEGLAPIRAKLSATEWKAAVRAAFQLGGEWWIGNYLPLRFTKYARAKLNYELHSSHIKRKKDFEATDPLVWTGQTRDAVLGNAHVAVGGSADHPYADIKMATPGPRAPIVYQVLNTILDSEMPGVSREIADALQAILAQAVTLGGRSKRLTLAGASTSLSSPAAAVGRARIENRQTVRDAAEDDRVRITEARPAAIEMRQNRLKRTHDRWRRTSGGSAPVGGDGGQMAASYANSSRYRHAAAQRRHRARYA
jgi:hypothetical protein